MLESKNMKSSKALERSNTCYTNQQPGTHLRKNMVANKEHNLHTAQGPRDALPEQETSNLSHSIQLQEYGKRKSKRGWKKLRNHFGI